MLICPALISITFSVSSAISYFSFNFVFKLDTCFEFCINLIFVLPVEENQVSYTEALKVILFMWSRYIILSNIYSGFIK